MTDILKNLDDDENTFNICMNNMFRAHSEQTVRSVVVRIYRKCKVQLLKKYKID